MWLKGLFGSKGRSRHRSPAPDLPKLTVVLRHGEDGYMVAECIDLPGCMSQGKTVQEALENIIDAIQSCLSARIYELLKESRSLPPNLVGIEAQETFEVKPPELELVC